MSTSFKRYLSIVTIISLSFGVSLSMFTSPSFAKQAKAEIRQSGKRAEFVPDQLIVKLKDAVAGDTEAAASTLLRSKGLKVKKAHSLLKSNAKIKSNAKMKALADKMFTIDLEAGSNVMEIARSLKGDSRVAYAEPNFIVNVQATPNDPMFSQQWDLHNTGQMGGLNDADIDAPEAWDVTKDSTVVVGVIDTGVDYTHPDLVDNMWTNPGEIAGNGIDDDANGFIDDVYGWDFANGDNDPMDDYGHGTHCAGTIGAKSDNGVGIAGINWNAKIAAIKFLDAGGGGTYEAGVESVLYANMMGFKITSNSWGGGGYSQALYDAISAANDQGNLFIAAAGNSGNNADQYPMYPGAFDLPNIISVAATDQNDQLSYFSNYGMVSVDLAAPGEETLSTVPDDSCSLCDPSGYMFLSGTSMATPHVSGAAALLWAEETQLTAAEVKAKILDSAEALESLTGKVLTQGRLNLQNFFEVDTTPPAAATDLTAEAITHKSVAINWTATGDDGMTGTASRYDVRYSVSPITEANFTDAEQTSGAPKPANPGQTDSMTISYLDPSTTYYIALKVIDNVGNASAMSTVITVTTAAATIVFGDDVESGTNGWTTDGMNLSVEDNLWHISGRRSVSPTNSWYYGIESKGNYDNGYRNISILTSPVIQLTDITDAELLFTYFLEKENSSYYDVAKVQIKSTDSTYWLTIIEMNATNGAFVEQMIDISNFDGQEVQVRFQFDTVDSFLNGYEGWYIDDIIVRGAPAINTPPVADAGSDLTGSYRQSVTFDGSLSSDAEGPIKSYAWQFGDGFTATTAVATHAYNACGTFIATLTVTDAQDVPASDTVTVTIKDNVTIPSAVYQVKKTTLVVKAKTDAKDIADLMLVEFPQATKKKITNGFEFKVTNLATKPVSVTVTSSLGGTATSLVK